MELTRTPDIETPPFRFVPAEMPLDAPAELEPFVQELLARPLATAADLRAWIVDWGELGSRVDAEWARRLTAMNRDTKSAALRDRLLKFQRGIMPAWQKHDDALTRRYLASPLRKELGAEFAVFDRDRRQAAEIFREENATLLAEAEGLAARFQEIQGSITVPFGGRELTKEQCAAELQATDRKVREAAYRALGKRMLAERDAIDDVYDELIALRHRIATNAGFDSYVDFRFAELCRFDYTPADCAAYHRAVEKVVVPAVRDLRALRRKRLGLEALRPYDLEVSLFGNEPRTLFTDQAGFVGLVRRVFEAVDPVFASDFDILVRNDLLDLMSRPGKSPGGYNCAVEDMRLPFIFYNAVGRRGDVRVMLHEGGHAFHTLATRNVDILPYRSSPTEFGEVASMSMELFGLERLQGILDEQEFREYVFGQLDRTLGTFTLVALIDAFQAWIYAHPDHTREERRAKWVELSGRFGPDVDWAGLDEIRDNGWQRIPHLFSHPLYFIEYGIAEIGALQMWKREKENHAAAVAGYRRALALGGSRPLPELFQAAGIRFAMDERILGELIPDVHAQARAMLG